MSVGARCQEPSQSPSPHLDQLTYPLIGHQLKAASKRLVVDERVVGQNVCRVRCAQHLAHMVVELILVQVSQIHLTATVATNTAVSYRH